MGTFLLSLITGIVAGAFTARAVVRHELQQAGLGQRRPTPAPAPAAPPPSPAFAPKPQPAPPAASEEITPEILTVLTAAVAAFLGKRAKIRSARVHTGMPLSSAWAQQGRVFVQASHNLPLHH